MEYFQISFILPWGFEVKVIILLSLPILKIFEKYMIWQNFIKYIRERVDYPLSPSTIFELQNKNIYSLKNIKHYGKSISNEHRERSYGV